MTETIRKLIRGQIGAFASDEWISECENGDVIAVHQANLKKTEKQYNFIPLPDSGFEVFKFNHFKIKIFIQKYQIC